MSVWNRIKKGLFWAIIFVLLVAPLLLIFVISKEEMREYEAPSVPVFVKSSYGEIVQAERRDMKDYVVLSGRFTSDMVEYIELEHEAPERIRWTVKVGDEIQVGQVLGTYDGESVISTKDGILEGMNVYDEKPYLTVRLLSPVMLECEVTGPQLTTLRSAKELRTERDEKVSLKYASKVRTSEGLYVVRLAIDSELYYYGQVAERIRVYNGYSYLDALTLPEKCVYQKTVGENQPWYVRRVNEYGVFIEEIQVGRGYSNGDYVCVTGVEEGDWFDTGYKAIIGG